MKKKYGNVILITGASSGIGLSLAKKFAENGYKVYGTTRKDTDNSNTEEFTAKNGEKGFIKMVTLDVNNDKSVEKAVNYIKEKEGHIDILVNNAGFGIAGSVEDTNINEAKAQFETNFFGVHRMIRKVLPLMRENKGGLIVNISSVAGYISIPFQPMYSAVKYSLEALTEALRIEVKPFNIKAVLIEPGDTATGFTKNRITAENADHSKSIYKNRYEKSVKRMENDEVNGTKPEKVAKTVFKISKRKNPPVRITVGIDYKVLRFLNRFMPDKLKEYIVSGIYG